MWYQTKITQLLGIKYPILLGPMGGGFSTPQLLAAVSNAGGLGSFGMYTFTPEEMLAADEQIKALTDKPYNINLWVNDVDAALQNYPAEKLAKIKALYQPYFDELGLIMPDISTDISSKFDNQVEALFKIRPAVFSFIFGIPSPEILNECRKLNIKTIGAATTLDEALALEESGVNAIVAAGFEAGGHRPSFLRPADDSLTGAFALVQQLKAKVKTPVIATGGIADAKGAAAMFGLGADAVQIGTAFLACDESNATKEHRDALFLGAAKHTVLSKSLTGRMGRMIGNRIAADISYDTEVLPFPLQNKYTAVLKAEAYKQGRTDLINFWSGQNAISLKHTQAAELMQALITETGNLIK